uniref:Retrovirus-related Pol polyprotein from transposon TNT 1-94 n=1 Tax=Tanacetum cinerariifolium TaxID=118510 RepID=A0A6L2MM88_TANCI|nr:retrovirus-related Pol polyprotein from transposon TNT 1-94 [Tanacetum cinerariifolium]
MEERKLRHLRYGHVEFKGVHLLKNKQMVTNLPSKYVKVVYMENSLSSQKLKTRYEILEIVHADLCGSMITESSVGSKYLLFSQMIIAELVRRAVMDRESSKVLEVDMVGKKVNRGGKEKR